MTSFLRKILEEVLHHNEGKQMKRKMGAWETGDPVGDRDEGNPPGEGQGTAQDGRCVAGTGNN